MSPSPLAQAFATLGLQPGCSWEEVRQQYRRLAFAWHPDRHVATPDTVEIEERAKEINAAFEVLSSYYRAQARSADRSPVTSTSPGEPALPEFQTDALTPGTRVTPSTGTYVLGAVAIAASAFWLLSWLATEPETGFEAASGSDASRPVDGDPIASRGAASHDAVRARFERIRTGSSTDEVLQAVGVPSRVDGDVWYYDAAMIVFRNGTVVGWQSTTGSSPDRAVAPADADQRVTYGSTREEVRRILGAPAAEGDAQWTYGPSQIYFEDGRVSGWYISPLQPLRVRER